MALPDPSLGIPYGFDPALFRNAITFAEQMGAPPDVARRAKFVKPSAGRTYWKDGAQLLQPPVMGRDGQPLDMNVEVRAQEPVIIDTAACTVEIERADADELPVGNFRNTKAVVTLLDVDYAKVEDCKELRYNGDRYVYGYEPDALGLFGVGIHVMIFYAVDES